MRWHVLLQLKDNKQGGVYKKTIPALLVPAQIEHRQSHTAEEDNNPTRKTTTLRTGVILNPAEHHQIKCHQSPLLATA